MADSGNFYKHNGQSLFDVSRVRFRKRHALVLAGFIAVVITPVAAALQTRTGSDSPHQETSSTTTTTSGTSQSQSSSNSTETTLQGTTDAQVIINGQNVPVPQSGRINETIPTDDGRTNVDIKIKNKQKQTTGDQNSSNTQIEIKTQSHSSGDVDEEDSRHRPRR